MCLFNLAATAQVGTAANTSQLATAPTVDITSTDEQKSALAESLTKYHEEYRSA